MYNIRGQKKSSDFIKCSISFLLTKKGDRHNCAYCIESGYDLWMLLETFSFVREA